MSPRLAVLVCLSLSACNDDGTAASTTSGSSSSSGEPPGDSSATTQVEPTSGEPGTSSSSSSGEPGFDPPVPTCGNGYLEGAEECDDGNLDDGDGCNASCLVPCGLELEVLELAPTAQSVIGGLVVAPGPDGGFVAIAQLREITVDQEQMSTVGPRQILVLAYDVAGELRWREEVGVGMGDLYAAGGAVDPNGDVLLIGSVDGADASDIWIGKLAGEDGASLWTQAVDGALANGDDFGTAIVATAEGDAIAVGQVRDAMNDADVWVHKLAGADGAEVWTTTWSGAPDMGYSIDAGGRVGVAADGSVYVAAREFVNSDTTEVTLLKFAADGAGPLWTASPLADGTTHKHNYGPMAVGADGEVALGVVRGGAGATFWLYRYASAGGAPLWSLEDTAFITTGDEWSLDGLGMFADGDVVVGGSRVDDVSMPGLSWVELWTARLDARGAKRCQVGVSTPGEDLLPPSLFAAGFAAGADGAALATGERVEGGESAVWTGRFRPL